MKLWKNLLGPWKWGMIFGALLIAQMCFSQEEKAQYYHLKAPDGIEIRALYKGNQNQKRILLLMFHQADSSLGEFSDLFSKFNQLGFNCLAVDLRSGKNTNGIDNQTHLNALKANLSTSYLDAFQDMEAGLKWAKQQVGKGRIFIIGSSFSASLSLRLAAEFPAFVDGLVLFSPGEYFFRLGKSAQYIQKFASKIKVPTLILSKKDEKRNWANIFEAIPTEYRHSFLPKIHIGQHGAKSLWKIYPESREYWNALTIFLTKLK